MRTGTILRCRCDAVQLRATGAPIMGVECCCTTCRAAGRRFEQLAGGEPVLTELGTTPYAMYRKDRIEVVAGGEQLREHRLEPGASTRRVLAACCNTPMFLEFERGHWLSVYAHLWPADTRPRIELRTMCRSIEPGVTLPDDVPNPRTHTAGFMLRLLRAWVAMGFRAPKVRVDGTLDA